MKQPAAILVVRRFVDASMKTIPQNEEPRSAIQDKAAASPTGPKVDWMNKIGWLDEQDNINSED